MLTAIPMAGPSRVPDLPPRRATATTRQGYQDGAYISPAARPARLQPHRCCDGSGVRVLSIAGAGGALIPINRGLVWWTVVAKLSSIAFRTASVRAAELRFRRKLPPRLH